MTTRTEKDVGITEYISTHDGFRGIIKARYQDFVVHEINSMGTIVNLNKLTYEDSTQESTTFVNVLSEKNKEDLALLLQQPNDKFILLPAGPNKQDRTNIHNSVREMFPELQSSTITNPGDACVQIKVSKGNLNNRKQARSRKKYCKFVLYKESIDTMSAVNVIAKKTKIRNSKMFQYAGTKDKRAITVQEITVPINHERLLTLANLQSNICIGNFTYCEKPLHLGDLHGNHFKIVLRNIDGNKEQIEVGMASFKSTGFINYFGMQRFGTTNVPTYEIGIAILKGNWDHVVSLLLSEENVGHSDDIKTALNEYKRSKDAAKALTSIKNKRCIEASLLHGIVKHGQNQPMQAFNLISRNMRLLYLHSVQSLIWNKVASERISKYGLKPIVGDLVYKHQYDEYLILRENPAAKKRKLDVEKEIRTQKRSCPEVVTLKEEDVDDFTICDVVLPLPGHTVTYPNYYGINLYDNLLKAHELHCRKSFVNKMQDYSLPGVYRKLIIKPNNVEHEILRYNSCKEPLILTDKDILNGTQLTPLPEGKFCALKLEFSLPPSSYATVAIRELLKTDLSATSQNQMTLDHMKECIAEEESIGLKILDT